MNLTRLIFRNLWYYRKPYLAVMAGVAISTAVLTGALIVGDSVRFSLQQFTDIRLGKTRYAMQSNDRFFRQELAAEISAHAKLTCVAVLQVGGIAINSDKNLRINQVQIIGVDEQFGQFRDQPLPVPTEDEAIISRNTAIKLDLKPGDELLLRIQKPGKAPSNAPFVEEKTPSVSIRVRVAAVAGDDQLGRFSLKNNQTAPYNIFLQLKQISRLLELPGQANLLIVAEDGTHDQTAAKLDTILWKCWKPADAGLNLKALEPSTIPPREAGSHLSSRTLSGGGDSDMAGESYKHGKYELTTDRIFFDDSTARAIQTVIPGCESLLTYLVNSISNGNRSTPYSFVTAASESFLKQSISETQIIINEWLADDLGVKPGDSVMLRYFLMGPLRSLREDSSRFAVISVIPLSSSLSDPALMPDFPGMSDAGNCRDWETGAPVNLKKIRDKDEFYWQRFRGTPKAFVSIAAGEQLWSNRFGKYTAFRFEARETDLPGIVESVMRKIKPGQAGMVFRPVYQEGQLAAANSTDFGELFLSLSFFILVSALLLTVMLFSLLAQSRTGETGLLSSIGFRKQHILRILSTEALVVSFAGAIPGIFIGILYNRLLIFGLNTIWNDAVNASQIVMAVRFPTLLAGLALGMITSIGVLLAVVWKNLRKPLSILTKGAAASDTPVSGSKKLLITTILATGAICISAGLLLWLLITGDIMNVALFLASGGFMLAGELAVSSIFLQRQAKKQGNSIPGFRDLILRNLALRSGRTLYALSLMALGTFIIIITGANHKTFYGTETDRCSGTGGFLLWAETLLPINNDLNSEYGATKFGLRDEDVLRNVRYIQLSRIDGDDASCLNLNQVSTPAILGIPVKLFIERNGFTVISADSSVDRNRPWASLSSGLAPGIIPGFADQTVITWGLRKSVGDTLLYRDESGNILKIKLMGGLDNSVFQGNILVSDSLLRIYYPSAGSSRLMLIDAPPVMADTITGRLETLFRDYGITVTRASARLAAFNAVENTYLLVFLLLGGLGVIIGTLGLGIVLLRNIQQRRQELAVYLALGFPKIFILKCLITEHFIILATGLFLGFIAALAGILPSLLSPAFKAPVMVIGAIIMIILVNGLLWIYFPAKAAMKKDLLPGLRDE
jgi:ABC-type antimicrobial peptide transport system permease subunit